MRWHDCWCGASPAERQGGRVLKRPGDASTLKLSLWRRGMNQAANGFAIAAAVLVIVPLMAIFIYLLIKGVGALNWAFLTQTPKPVGEAGGGMANAIVGSGVILGIASVIGIPMGIGCGIYLAEYGRGRFGDLVRFTADVLNGVPSIVIGIRSEEHTSELQSLRHLV